MTHTIKIHCDIVHPASGEVLAEVGDTIDARTPKAKRVLSVVVEYPEHYHSTLIVDSPPFDDVNLEGCPTDEEIQIASWSEGRGYGYFPKEGL